MNSFSCGQPALLQDGTFTILVNPPKDTVMCDIMHVPDVIFRGGIERPIPLPSGARIRQVDSNILVPFQGKLRNFIKEHADKVLAMIYDMQDDVIDVSGEIQTKIEDALCVKKGVPPFWISVAYWKICKKNCIDEDAKTLFERFKISPCSANKRITIMIEDVIFGCKHYSGISRFHLVNQGHKDAGRSLNTGMYIRKSGDFIFNFDKPEKWGIFRKKIFKNSQGNFLSTNQNAIYMKNMLKTYNILRGIPCNDLIDQFYWFKYALTFETFRNHLLELWKEFEEKEEAPSKKRIKH